MASLATARSLACILLVLTVVVLSSAACGSGIEPCVEADCAPGNKCLALFNEVKCRKVCSSNVPLVGCAALATPCTKDADCCESVAVGGTATCAVAGQPGAGRCINAPGGNCPFGFTCKAPLTGASSPFCVASKATRLDGRPVAQKPTGQWGASCKANLGIENKDCDGDQGFFCYGNSPTDARAYCTRYDCTNDDECGPGFWCGKINQTPNVATARHSTLGEVQRVCLRRSYCATCAADLDCPDIEGTKQHCIRDEAGTSFCAPECLGAGTCPNEAKCIEAGLAPPVGKTVAPTICYPRAKVCVGDGSLCSPCRVDTDCGEDGACVRGEYTTEKACAKRSTSCEACVAKIASPARIIGCSKEGTDALPKNYCVGLYNVGGTPSDAGCWTLDR